MPLSAEEPYAVLLCSDGTRTELSREAYDEVRKTLMAVQGGRVVANQLDPWLTTGEVACLLGYSRRTVARMLDAGEIPFERHGRGHRRVRYGDVLRYQDDIPAKRREALEEMRGIAYDAGAYDLDIIEGYLGQFT